MAQEPMRLSDFFARLAEEPELLGRFILRREEVLAELDLTDEQKELLRSGSFKDIELALRQENPDAVVFFYVIK